MDPPRELCTRRWLGVVRTWTALLILGSPVRNPRVEQRVDQVDRELDGEVLLRQSPYSFANPQQAIDSTGNAGIPEGNDVAGTGPAGVSPCSPIALTTFGANGTQGTWIEEAATVGDIPALDGKGLIALIALVAAVAVLALRR